MAPACFNVSIARIETRERGVSRGTRRRGQLSLSATAPALCMRFEQVPAASEPIVPDEQGTITVPSSLKEPEDIGAARSALSWKVRREGLPSSLPFALSLSSQYPSGRPVSSKRTRPPHAEQATWRETPFAASRDMRRRAYIAPEAPVIHTSMRGIFRNIIVDRYQIQYLLNRQRAGFR